MIKTGDESLRLINLSELDLSAHRIMIGDEHIAFAHFPAADGFATDTGIGEDVIDLYRCVLHKTVIGDADILGEVCHTGLLCDIDHFLTVGFSVHVTDKDAGNILCG